MANPQNKVVLITGATSGIGFATAQLLSRRDVHVVAVGHHQAALDTVARELPGALAVRADMTRPEEVRAMIETAHRALGRIDVLINNAGQGYEGAVADADMEQYDYLYRLNVLGPLTAMHAVVPLMRQAGGGRIINVCSPVAKLTLPGLGLYASTKAALRVLTLTARRADQRGDYGERVLPLPHRFTLWPTCLSFRRHRDTGAPWQRHHARPRSGGIHRQQAHRSHALQGERNLRSPCVVLPVWDGSQNGSEVVSVAAQVHNAYLVAPLVATGVAPLVATGVAPLVATGVVRRSQRWCTPHDA